MKNSGSSGRLVVDVGEGFLAAEISIDAVLVAAP
jgi:hypothetical protein